MLNAGAITAVSKPAYNWRGMIMRADLAPLTKLVLHTLAGHADEIRGKCYPTIELLVRHTGMSRSSVFNHLKNAEAAGWIERGKHGFKGQRWANNEYRLVIPNTSPKRAPSTAPDHASVPQEMAKTSVRSTRNQLGLLENMSTVEGDGRFDDPLNTRRSEEIDASKP